MVPSQATDSVKNYDRLAEPPVRARTQSVLEATEKSRDICASLRCKTCTASSSGVCPLECVCRFRMRGNLRRSLRDQWAMKNSKAEWREQHEWCGELMAPMPVSWGKGAVADARSHQVGDLCTTFLCDRLPVRSKAEGQQPRALHIIGPGTDI